MNKIDPLSPPRPCAICGAPQTAPWRPFCSKRCADVDLGSWLSERYALPDENGLDGGRSAMNDGAENL